MSDAYRVATTLDSQAGRFDKLKKPIEAATAYFQAAEAWWQTRIIKECVGSYISAIESFLDVNDEKNATVCLENVWKRLANEEHHEIALGVFNRLSSLARGSSLLGTSRGVMDSIPALIFNHTRCRLVIDTIANAAKVFKKLIFPSSDIAYVHFLLSLIEQLKKGESDRLIFALATAIEQAPETLFKMKEYQQICESIAECLPGLNYRCDSLIVERWIVYLPTQQVPAIEFQLASDQPSVRAIAAVCALVVWTQREKFISHIGTRKWWELGLSINLFSEGECRKRNMPGIRSLGTDFPVVFTLSNVPRGQPQPPCMVIVRDDFLMLADRALNPDNKHIIWTLMQLFNTILGHFTHFGIAANTLKRLRREFICETFDVTMSKRSGRTKRKP